MLLKITRLPLDAQMQRNRLDVDERVEGSSVMQLLTSRPSRVAHPSAPDASPPRYIHTYGDEASRARLLGPRVRRGESVGGAAAA
jgi:hypothetical protein